MIFIKFLRLLSTPPLSTHTHSHTVGGGGDREGRCKWDRQRNMLSWRFPFLPLSLPLSPSLSYILCLQLTLCFYRYLCWTRILNTNTSSYTHTSTRTDTHTDARIASASSCTIWPNSHQNLMLKLTNLFTNLLKRSLSSCSFDCLLGERGEGCMQAGRGSVPEGCFLMAAHDAKVFCADVIHLTRSTKPQLSRAKFERCDAICSRLHVQ